MLVFLILGSLALKAVSIIYNNYFSYETGENEVSEGKGNI